MASLVNVFARARKPLAYADLRAKTHVVDGHATFTDLARAATVLGVPMRGYRLASPEALKTDDLGVVELTADHFVAFVGRRGDRYLIVDSPDGGVHEPAAWSSARLSDEWTSNVLLVER